MSWPSSRMSDLYYIDTIILAFFVCFLSYKFATRNFDYWKKKGVPYVVPKLFVGNLLPAFTFKKTISHTLWDMYKKMPQPFFGIWVFNKPVMVVKSPELIRNVLVKDFKHFYDRNMASDPKADDIAAHVLFLVKNPEWKQIRAKMTPVFTSGKIKTMIPLMNVAGENLKNYLVKTSLRHKSLEAKEIFAKYATDLLTSCAFGLEAQSFERDDAPFRSVGREMFEFNFKNGIRALTYFFAPALVSLFKIKFIPPNTSKFLKDAFWKTIAERETTNFKRNDLIDLIIKLKNEDNMEGVNFEGSKVVAQAVQFFIAGFETTSSTMAFALYEMCLNKPIQQKLRAEIKSTLAEHGGITYDAIQNMKYLHKVISETLRKYPVLAFLDRCCMEDYKIPGTNVTIEKGTPVFISMYGLHYDPKYFPDPEKFDPERFSEDNINSRPNYTYIPFGTGPHNCIGDRFGLTTVKLGLIHVLSQFEVEATEDTPIPLKYATKTLIVASETGLPMRFVDTKRRVSLAA